MTNTTTPILQVKDLHLTYGSNPILQGVSFNLARGEVVSLLGASGSGKTTLLRAVAGLETPHQGSIHIAERDVFNHQSKTDIPAEGRNLGLVFQSYALWPHRSVFDNVAYGLKLRKTNAAETRQRVSEALQNLGLGHLAERYPHQLSGGQQQRVAIARALVYNPPVILLDEPLSNLDAKLREEARAWLRELITRLQLSALVVTHDQHEALAMSDRILLLNQGRIAQQGSPQDMYDSPQSHFVADFMGSNNRLSATVQSVQSGQATVQLQSGSYTQTLNAMTRNPLSAGDTTTLISRTSHAQLYAAAGPNRLPATLTSCMYLGERYEYRLQYHGNPLCAYGPAPLSPNSEHWVELPAQHLWAFSATT